MEIDKLNSLVELYFKKCEEVDPNKPFLKWLKPDKPTYNWGDIKERIFKLSYKIKSLINEGDRCLILSENRPYWLMADIAIMNAGGISVPIFTTYSSNDYEYILNDCKPSLVIVSNDAQFKKIKKIKLQQKIFRVDTSNLKKITNKLNNKYFISEGNKENLSFVLKIASKLKLNNTKLIKTLNNFKGLKYRQQIIFDNKNLTIINDSKSTSFASSESILKNFNDIYWILGGIPKKGDKFKLPKKKCRNFKVFIFGNYHKQFNRILRNKIKIKKLKNLKEILKKIFFEIKKQKIKKNTIFFSPAGASFDSFKNFEDRGYYFNKLIKKFINAKR